MEDTQATIGRRPVPGFPGYEADSSGDIWSCHIAGGTGGLGSNWRKLRQRLDKDGYPSVTLFQDRRRRMFKVAHVVLMTFVGPRPDGAESAHYPDPDPLNNAVHNLRWAAHIENIADKVDAGRQARGVTHGKARLSEQDVRDIRQMRASGMTVDSIGEQYGIAPAHVSGIVKRKYWRHVD